jgi:hypothetical protein
VLVCQIDGPLTESVLCGMTVLLWHTWHDDAIASAVAKLSVFLAQLLQQQILGS